MVDFVVVFGDRLGLIVFTVVLTIGQLIFAVGGYKESYWIMMAGRFVFGLGGESMTVAQSAIVSAWFQGRELAFAFGINLSVARIGSSINGPVVTALADDYSVGFALLVGFFICCFSLLMAFLLVWIDAWAAKKDGVTLEISEDEKFKLSDLKQFNRLPFWLVTFSCVIIYMVIFIYIQYASDMLQERFGFSDSLAGTFYALPYIISGVTSPILGFVIDKIGKRAIFSKYHYYFKRQLANKFICNDSLDILDSDSDGLYHHHTNLTGARGYNRSQLHDDCSSLTAWLRLLGLCRGPLGLHPLYSAR